MVTVMCGFWSPMYVSCFRFKYNDRHCIYRERKMKHAWIFWGLTLEDLEIVLCAYVKGAYRGVCTQTISRSSKSTPPAHSRMFHLSLAIYTLMIIVFGAKAWYIHWTSESTHDGHHLRFVVIIQSRAHDTALYLLRTWLVDQLNAPHGTSSVASHYLTTIGPTCLLVSTLHLHLHSYNYPLYKKQSWWRWCACHPAI